MANRQITHSIRSVLDVLDCCQLFDDSGFMLFVDLYKHQFILQSLHKLGFCSSTETLQKQLSDTNGVRQGWPASLYLFLPFVQLLADHIRSHMCLTAGQKSDHHSAAWWSCFTDEWKPSSSGSNESSGLHLNINNRELMTVKECSSTAICNIQVKWCWIIITKDQQRRTSLNLEPILREISP